MGGRDSMLELTRRSFLAGAASVLFPFSSLSRGRKFAAHERLWYTRPAARWDEAWPIGNGRLGAMLFGRVAQERLQLNEDTLWSGAPYTPDNPDALAAIPEVRKLLEARRYQEATELASAKVMAKPLQQMSYGSLGDLFLNFANAQVPAEYERSLDLTTAIATTRYRTQAGTFTRSAFASSPHEVIVMQLAARKGKLSFDLAYRAPRRVKYTSPEYQGAATPLATNEPVDWLMLESADEMPPDVRASSDAEDCILIEGRNAAGPSTPAGLTFALRIKIVSDGRVISENGRISVHDARTAVLVIGAATSYVS
jgi:alpha-L-fucosidase 2